MFTTKLQKEIDAVDLNSEKIQQFKRDSLAFEKRHAELSKDHDDSCPHCGTPEMFDFELTPELEKMRAKLDVLSGAEEHVFNMNIMKDEFLKMTGINKELLGPKKNPTAEEQETLDLLRGKKKSIKNKEIK